MTRLKIRLSVVTALLLACATAPSARAVTQSSTAVSDLSVSAISFQSVDLSWKAPLWGAEAVTDYQVEYMTTTENTWTTSAHPASVQTSAHVTGLYSGFKYAFRVTPLIGETAQTSRELGIRQIAVGMSHVCALNDLGEVTCWGDNTLGQLGNSDATVTRSSSPIKILGLSAVEIFAGRDHTCALIDNGTVNCWGSNSNGQLGTGDTSYPMSVAPRLAVGITNATHITSGAMHACAIVDSGSVKCWGAGAKYRLGLPSSYGQSDVPTPTIVSGLSGLTAVGISAGTSQSCALLSTHAVKCWGDNATGQVGSGTLSVASASPLGVSGIDGTLASAVQISMGSQHACALLDNGTAKCWGNGGNGRLGNSATSNSATPVVVKMANATLTGIRSITAGADSTCAIISAGEVVCWGNNATGQLGIGSLVSQSQATATGITDAISLSSDLGSNVSGSAHTCALLSGSKIKCWGVGLNYVLGNGLTTSSTLPVLAEAGVATVVTPVGAPDAPTWLPSTRKLHGLEIHWLTPNNNGSPITGLSVKFAGGPADGQTACQPSVTDTTCILNGLVAGQDYRFAISATNTVGEGPLALSDAVTTQTTGVSQGFNWQNTASSMTITGCVTSCQNIVIPASIDGDPVTAIAGRAFANPDLASISIPNNVTDLAASAFGSNKIPLANVVLFKPSIGSSPAVNSLLTISGAGSVPGTSRQYVWSRDGQLIQGANASTYRATTDDLGRSITATVTLQKTGRITISVSSSAVVIGLGTIARTSVPGISGTFRVGSVLTAKPGTWTTAVSFQYQWILDGVAVSGANQSTYLLSVSDLGKSIFLEITGTKNGYLGRSRISASHPVLLGVQPSIVGLSIQGTAKVGQVLTSSLSGAAYQFQWLRNGLALAGEIAGSYSVVSADVGRVISVRLTRTQAGYSPISKVVAKSGHVVK